MRVRGCRELCWGWAAEECEKCWVWYLLFPPASVQVNKKVQSVQAGGNVTFSCQSATKEDVIQVTWQKETDGTEDNIATYSVMNGQKIAKGYVGHVSFAHSELRASAISLHGVTLQDEGCYKCIFNTFPSGAVTGRMCLKVYGKALWLCTGAQLRTKSFSCEKPSLTLLHWCGKNAYSWLFLSLVLSLMGNQPSTVL